ncbi:M10 family metallopeptidase [uncultured Tateyamaria sp.]|uniref:M10 family metallopeptidase n=1 Tax=uncultured Tateyamaria sp. TaxID=455651 RepID=UPI0026228EE4|nr:M10 family metallopeptidase [uncultured Tateyamaria sp.]
MCSICFATRTFDPLRHDEGGDPAFANLTEDPNAPDSILTTNTMSVGDTFSGSLSESGDEDWIAVSLTAGEQYQFALDGGTLSDPLVRLFDAQGNQVAANDDGGPGLNSLLVHTATTTGTYFIVADAFSTQSGSYTVTFTDSSSLPEPGTPASLDDLALYLTEGFWGDRQISFDTTQSNIITVSIAGLTAAAQQLATWAMDAWEMVANLEFQIVTSGEMITMDDELSGAFAYAPNSGSSGGVELNVSQSWISTYGTSIDTYSFQTFMHEIGHAIGLGHQGDYNGNADYETDATFVNDSWQMSIMSYFNQTENTSITASYGFTATPMMADILAIQNLYGAPDASSVTAGDTTYGLGTQLGNYLDSVFDWLAGGGTSTEMSGNQMVFTLYDQGGSDTLDLSFASDAARLDLRAETFSDFGSLIGVMGIARGTVIENAILGSGDDRVTGNDAANAIDLGVGNDSIEAGGGNDSIMGGIGFDTIEGGDGNDSLFGGNGADSLLGGDGDDQLEGGDGFDQINGGAGHDRILAGATADRVYGGDGNDWISGGSNLGITVDGLWGEAGDDTLVGDGGFDLLDGGDGNDLLDGGHQADNLYGRAGNDVMRGGLGLDRLFGGEGDDLGHGGEGDDGLFGDAGNDSLFGEAGNDRFFGGSGNDLLNGGEGNDTLNGGSGFDTIEAGSGDDLMFGRFNADTFVFADGHGNDTIGDFNALNNFERIDLSGVSAISGLVDLVLGSDTTGAATRSGSDVVIDTGNGNSILLSNVTLSDLDSFDFIF